MENVIQRNIERLNQIANHFVLCPHCENCRKSAYIVQAIDHVRGDLDRALLPKKLPVLFTEPVAREKLEREFIADINLSTTQICHTP